MELMGLCFGSRVTQGSRLRAAHRGAPSQPALSGGTKVAVPESGSYRGPGAELPGPVRKPRDVMRHKNCNRL
jgi:hypothetical protein